MQLVAKRSCCVNWLQRQPKQSFGTTQNTALLWWITFMFGCTDAGILADFVLELPPQWFGHHMLQLRCQDFVA